MRKNTKNLKAIFQVMAEEIYVDAKTREFDEFRIQVTEWEKNKYFESL